MTLGFGTSTTAEFAKPRRAAHWLVLAVVLVLNWVATPLKAAEAAPCEAAVAVLADVSQLTTSQTSGIVLRQPEHSQTDQSVAELVDELISAPRSAQTADYGTGIVAGFIYPDPHAAFPRIFNPRAPPRLV
jgi:hypothetical protein